MIQQRRAKQWQGNQISKLVMKIISILSTLAKKYYIIIWLKCICAIAMYSTSPLDFLTFEIIIVFPLRPIPFMHSDFGKGEPKKKV